MEDREHPAPGPTVPELSAQHGEPSGPQLAALIQRRAGGAGGSGALVAGVVIALWEAIDGAIGPVIGGRGVSALYQRSLHLSAREHAWLGVVYAGVQAPIDMVRLQSALAAQSGDVAVSGGTLLLQTFHELLLSLVGPFLTERLLRPVWNDLSNDAAAQDLAP